MPAIEAALNGRDFVVVTPTASGKTLCYNAPVLDAILKLDGYTRIMVTHDLDENILRRCTGLFALKNGRISEQGSFSELMDQKGYFYSLYTVAQGE